MKAWATTTVQATLNLRDVRRLPILLAPDQIRTGITSAVSSLENKIEQNRRTSAALEHLARAMFRAWFVEFEPVKAKAAGATVFPSMPQEIFESLPTRMVDSEVGPVPEGWGVRKLGDFLRLRGERLAPSEETERLAYVPIDCITSKRVTLQEFKSGNDAKSSLVRFHEGDVLFGAMRPYFHKVCLAPFEGTTRTTCFVLVPRVALDRAFTLILVSEETTIEYATNHSVGSTIPYAKWEGSLENMPCIGPPQSIRKAFGSAVDPSLAHCAASVRESRKLAQLRDYLLPKLLSGDVRVGVSDA